MSKFISKVLLSIFSMLICLIALEIGFRILAPTRDTTLHTDRSTTYFKPPKANSQLSSSGDEERITIGVIGDSFAQGAGVQEYDRFSGRLEYMFNLNKITPKIQVNNYARSGTSTFQQLDQLDQALDNSDDIVLLQITLNDTEDWTDPKRIYNWRNEILPSKPSKWMRPVLRTSKVFTRAYTKNATAKSKKAFLEYYQNIYDPEYSGWKRFESSIKLFKERCEIADTHLRVVVFPLFSHDLAEHRYPFIDMHDKIREVLIANEITYLDLYDAYKNIHHVRLEAIPGIDPHPNEIAHRIAAEKLVDFLIGQGPVENKYYPTTNYPGKQARWQQIHEQMNLFAMDPDPKKDESPDNL